MRKLDIILVAIVFLLGAGLAYSIMKAKYNKIEANEALIEMRSELDSIRSEYQNILDVDSLKSAIERDLMMKNDSIIDNISQQLRLIKADYKKLKLTDEQIQAKLDGITIPVLPDF